LKNAQEQLIQAEKLSYLGQLTAGIAHEIQNPLNFVRNFSEVSKELCDELQEEINLGNTGDAVQLSTMLSENLDKIFQHSTRASSIIKSMLQHSRASSKGKQPVDIIALVKDSLSLSYQALQSKFNLYGLELHTHYDLEVVEIDCVKQDMERVLLNLFNNAFYAVHEKAKLDPEGYKPAICISTKMDTNAIEILVKDNGTGIPEEIIDKIFQPFFTTKPTGEGTGLGLSLSYDIIKTNKGELTVRSEVGAWTEFIIKLPV
jgi:two-component system, NtrC family, sensor kinase